MKKRLIVIGLMLVLLTIGLSGCIKDSDKGSDDSKIDTEDEAVNFVKSDLDVQEFINNYTSRGFQITYDAVFYDSADKWSVTITAENDDDDVQLTIVFTSQGIVDYIEIEEEESEIDPFEDLEGLGYVNGNEGFGLNPPEDWTIDEDDPYGLVRFYGPIEDEFQMNLGISEPSELTAGQTLENLMDDIILNYPSFFTNFSMVSSNARTVNGMNAYDIVYTLDQGSYNLKAEQVLIEKNGVVYIITYTASDDAYANYISIAEQSISSFTII